MGGDEAVQRLVAPGERRAQRGALRAEQRLVGGWVGVFFFGRGGVGGLVFWPNEQDKHTPQQHKESRAVIHAPTSRTTAHFLPPAEPAAAPAPAPFFLPGPFPCSTFFSARRASERRELPCCV